MMKNASTKNDFLVAISSLLFVSIHKNWIPNFQLRVPQSTISNLFYQKKNTFWAWTPSSSMDASYKPLFLGVDLVKP